MMSMELSTSSPEQNGLAVMAQPQRPQGVFYSISEVVEMATMVADSHMYAGVDTPAQAFTLMMLCQSQGLHPFEALRRYHIIENRPSMRADAIQAEFQARGGKVKILELSATRVKGWFQHDVLQPDGFTYEVTFQEFKDTGLTEGKYGTKANWKMSPADMLWARCSSKVIKKIYPGIVAGIYIAEDLEDAMVMEQPAAKTLAAQNETRKAIAQDDTPVYGWPPGEYDPRSYPIVVKDMTKYVLETYPAMPPLGVAQVHKAMVAKAVNAGHIEGPGPQSTQPASAALTKIYEKERAWTRAALNEVVHAHVATQPENRPAAQTVKPPETASKPSAAPSAAVSPPLAAQTPPRTAPAALGLAFGDRDIPDDDDLGTQFDGPREPGDDGP